MKEALAADLDIEQILAEVKQLANRSQFVIVPAIPGRARDSGFLVMLDPDDITAADFCALAAAASARILYIQADPFSAEDDIDVPEDDFSGVVHGEQASAQLIALREEASIFDGRIGELALGFAADGVLHCWIATAAWYDNLQSRTEEAMSGMGTGERLPEAEARALTARLAQELIEMPSFRSAATTAQRNRVARTQHAEIAALQDDKRLGYRNAAWQAVRQAEIHVADEADRIYAEMEGRLSVLAVEVAEDPSFRNAGSARARRERARDFIAAKAGGYPPPTRFLELLLDTPPLQRARTERH